MSRKQLSKEEKLAIWARLLKPGELDAARKELEAKLNALRFEERMRTRTAKPVSDKPKVRKWRSKGAPDPAANAIATHDAIVDAVLLGSRHE